MQPVFAQLVWTSRANCEKLACYESRPHGCPRPHWSARSASAADRRGAARLPDWSPSGSAPPCSTGGWRCPPGCPASATWPPAWRCPAPPSAPPTALLREQGWLDSRRGRGEHAAAAGSGIGPPAVAGARRSPGGIFGSRRRPGSLRPADGCRTTVDLTTACLPAPAEPLAAAVRPPPSELPRYTGGDGYLPFGLPVLREAIAAQIHRRRGADHRRADPGHLRRPARVHPGRSASCPPPATGC